MDESGESTGTTEPEEGDRLGQVAQEVEEGQDPVMTGAPGDDQEDETLDERDSEYEADTTAGAMGGGRPTPVDRDDTDALGDTEQLDRPVSDDGVR